MSFFSEKKAADYIRQILMAVNYCHEQNIVHRDLKPENVLFVNESQDSKLKVIDFGTSRKFDSLKKMTKRLGTVTKTKPYFKPYYIAPEVLNHQYNEKCDIWSCGVILYILLCGYPPFTGKTEKDILDKVKTGSFRFDRKKAI
jgi:calcium-dependent protein kinase